VEVCRHFRSWKSERRAAILAMSAYGHEIDLDEVRSSGADDFIPKPVRLADFRGSKNVVLAFYVLAFTGG
jgi:CheY-like chemotaxis protein